LAHNPEEWLRQADYDIATAEFMLSGKRNFYAVFMCHLAVEKALKGLFYTKLSKTPPKVHNLVYLLNELGVKPPERIGKFVVKLSEASVATRYPEDIARLEQDFTERVVVETIAMSKEALEWIKMRF